MFVLRGSYGHIGCPVELNSHKSKLTKILLSNEYLSLQSFQTANTDTEMLKTK